MRTLATAPDEGVSVMSGSILSVELSYVRPGQTIDGRVRKR